MPWSNIGKSVCVFLLIIMSQWHISVYLSLHQCSLLNTHLCIIQSDLSIPFRASDIRRATGGSSGNSIFLPMGWEREFLLIHSQVLSTCQAMAEIFFPSMYSPLFNEQISLLVYREKRERERTFWWDLLSSFLFKRISLSHLAFPSLIEWQTQSDKEITVHPYCPFTHMSLHQLVKN